MDAFSHTCRPLLIQSKVTPVIAPGFNDTTDQFTFGVNWYLDYWVLVKSEVNLDRLKDPSVQGILPHNYYVFLETLQFRF